MISFDVRGEPAPKGSSRAFARPGGGAVLVPGGSKINREKVKSWAGAVGDAAVTAMADREILIGPLLAIVEFRFVRPTGHYGKGKNAARVKDSAPRWHMVKPDIDKIARATLDALTGIVFRDDAQVARLELSKKYTEGAPGASIVVVRADPANLAAWHEGATLDDRFHATAVPRPHPAIDPEDFGGSSP